MVALADRSSLVSELLEPSICNSSYFLCLLKPIECLHHSKATIDASDHIVFESSFLYEQSRDHAQT